MNNIETLRQEADRYRSEFIVSVSAVSRDLSPRRLLDRVVGAVDPARLTLGKIETEIQRNPLALLAAFGGLWLFIQQVSRKSMTTAPATRPRPRSFRMSRAIPKGH